MIHIEGTSHHQDWWETERAKDGYYGYPSTAYIDLVELFRRYPDLERMYNYNPTARASIEVLTHSCTRSNILDLIYHLLITTSNQQSLITDAVNRGYYPQPKYIW